MAKLGSIAWADATHGTLSLTDKLTMLRQEVQRQLTLQWRSLTGKPTMRVSTADLDEIVIPDSALAVGALHLSESVCPQSLVFHTLRTYFWASILAKQDGLKPDVELLYVMAVLHDIGLTATYNHEDGKSLCFAVEGGRAAGAFVREHGTPQQAELIEDGIIRHLNLIVTPDEGVEAHLIHDGTILDVVGARHREIDRETITGVLERYPRLSFKQDLIALFNAEYAERPQSRIAFMQQVANLNKLIEKAPFGS